MMADIHWDGSTECKGEQQGNSENTWEVLGLVKSLPCMFYNYMNALITHPYFFY